jgi:putative protein-disulfide isomerase
VAVAEGEKENNSSGFSFFRSIPLVGMLFFLDVYSMTLIYCYDAYCGWCYGFSPVIRKIAEDYRERIFIEVLSGGMIRENVPISYSAGYVSKAYKMVEERTGIKFGDDFLWHIFHPDQSDWILNSEKAAIALCIFKDYRPGLQVQFASDLQYALKFEGRDLTDEQAYRHLLAKYQLSAEEFYEKLRSEEYHHRALEEFSIVQRLQVRGFPALFLQTGDSKYYRIADGFTDYETVKSRIDPITRI